MKPATSPAAICPIAPAARAGADGIDHRDAARPRARWRRAGGNAGNPPAAILGPQETIRRSLLSYQRQQEEQADRAGVKFLAATGQSAKGMDDTFKRMSDEILFAARNADPYMQSHPMPAERVRRSKSSPSRARTGTRRIRRSCSCVTT